MGSWNKWLGRCSAYIEYEGNSKCKGHRADRQHEDLVTFEIVLKPISQTVFDGCDNDFNGSELEELNKNVPSEKVPQNTFCIQSCAKQCPKPKIGAV